MDVKETAPWRWRYNEDTMLSCWLMTWSCVVKVRPFKQGNLASLTVYRVYHISLALLFLARNKTRPGCLLTCSPTHIIQPDYASPAAPRIPLRPFFGHRRHWIIQLSPSSSESPSNWSSSSMRAACTNRRTHASCAASRPAPLLLFSFCPWFCGGACCCGCCGR